MMKAKIFTAALCLNALFASLTANAAEPSTTSSNFESASSSCPSFLNTTMRKLHSKETVDICQLTKDKVVLMVNTASNCGFTPQFKSLEALHQQYKDQGLVVIGFPSNDFYQEEDDEKDTADVCFVNYGVTFTMVETSEVRGSGSNAIFKHLGDKTTSPKWNFYKYLVANNGQNISHFNSRIKPDDKSLITAIEQALALK